MSVRQRNSNLVNERWTVNSERRRMQKKDESIKICFREWFVLIRKTKTFIIHSGGNLKNQQKPIYPTFTVHCSPLTVHWGKSQFSFPRWLPNPLAPSSPLTPRWSPRASFRSGYKVRAGSCKAQCLSRRRIPWIWIWAYAPKRRKALHNYPKGRISDKTREG